MKRFNPIVIAAAVAILGAAPASADYGAHFGLGVGVTAPQDTELGETMAITGIVGLPTFSKHVYTQLFVDYWREAEQFAANEPESSLRDFSFGFLFKYNFHLSKPLFRPYVGTGAGVHLYKAENIPVFDIPQESAAKLGINVLGGLAVQVNKAVDLTVEAQYIWSKIDQLTGRVGVLIRTGAE
jgi:hypothetical protein